MKWFEVNEQSAGKKRLLLTWYLYNIFGERILYVIAFGVSFFIFIFVPKIRGFSKKYLEKVQKYTNLKPNLVNQFKHIFACANAFADKILVFSGNYNIKNIVFDSETDKNQLYGDINKNRGTFFICNHVGNVEVLHSLFEDTISNPNCEINIFLSHKQSQIFNNFLKSIKKEFPAKLFPIEDIGLTTGIDLKDNLNKGDVVFIAGDRLSESGGKSIEVDFFDSKIHLPKGAFKLAKLMEVPTYFISVIKLKKEYVVFVEKQENLSEKILVNKYVKFMEKIILKAPLQFFHFYDFFE